MLVCEQEEEEEESALAQSKSESEVKRRDSQTRNERMRRWSKKKLLRNFMLFTLRPTFINGAKDIADRI